MSERVRYIDQSHHLLSLFRQQSDEERRETLEEMADIIDQRFCHEQMSDEEGKAAATLKQMISHHLGASVPPSPWALAHLAVDWGQLDLTRDVGPHVRRLGTAGGTRTMQEKTERLLQAAMADIALHPTTGQRECAARLLKAGLGVNNQDHAFKAIGEMFVSRGLGKKKRPRPDLTIWWENRQKL